MNSSNSGGKLEKFFNGKGFYIVLFLCAAVIGVSAWMMAAGNGTMEEATEVSGNSIENRRVETVIIPPRQETQTVSTPVPTAPAVEEPAEESTQVWTEDPVQPAAIYAWPVTGELGRGHSVQTLQYDVTMRDWRTHAGIDILAPLGTTVTAAHAGTVESVVRDDLMGTVVTVAHGDGTRSIYANLADVPAVNPGDWVETGAVIGSVGDTALCEIGQETHLHFAITVNGTSANPLDFLPA